METVAVVEVILRKGDEVRNGVGSLVFQQEDGDVASVGLDGGERQGGFGVFLFSESDFILPELLPLFGLTLQPSLLSADAGLAQSFFGNSVDDRKGFVELVVGDVTLGKDLRSLVL